MAIVENIAPLDNQQNADSSPLLFFGALTFASFIALGFSNDPIGLIVAIVIVWLGGGFAVRWDPLHPYTIFGTGMMLYAIAAPLLQEFDLFQRPLYLAAEALQILYLSFVLVYVAIWPTRRLSTRVREFDTSAFLTGAKVVIAIFLPICALSIVYPAMSGFTSKQEIAASGGALTRLSYYSALNVGVSFLVLAALHKGNLAALWRALLPFALFYVLAIGFVGQRYGIYYLGIATLVLVSAFRSISMTQLAVLGVVALGLNTLLGGLKLFIAQGLIGEDVVGSTLDFYGTDDFNYWLAYEDLISRTFKTALLALLGSEPTTVADNLNTLLELVPSTYPHTYGSSTLGDIGRAFSLGFLQDVGSGVGALAQNSTVLFNTWVQLEGLLEGSGIGFCMICTGYLDFGIAGVIAISIVLGLALRVSYGWACANALGLVFYANLIPIAMTSLRQDLSQIISTPLKQLGIPLLIILLFMLFARREQAPSAAD
jgi:hypothetical protein